MREMKVEGRLLGPVIRLVDSVIGKGLSELKTKKGRDMQDLYKEFSEWLTYNFPGIKLGLVQENLVKMALRNWDVKVAKVAGKAIIKEVANLIVTGDKDSPTSH